METQTVAAWDDEAQAANQELVTTPQDWPISIELVVDTTVLPLPQIIVENTH